MGTMVLNRDAKILNEELKRLSLLVALDMADISDELATAELETDPDERKGLRSGAREFLESASSYDISLNRLKSDGALNVIETAEADRLLQGVSIIVAAGKSILHMTRQRRVA